MADPHSPPAAFADLEIRLLRRWPEGYPVEITLSGQQEFPRGYLSADILPWVAADPGTDGQRLFDRLMADAPVRSAWAAARGQAPRRRIRLRIDADAPELHALPWELLQDNALTLAASSETPFSRYLPIALPWGGEITERPIRVLAVISNPDDLTAKYNLPPADVALEQQALTDALGGAKDLAIDFLDAPVTLEKIEAALRKGYHVLHFLGHGAFNAKRQQAALYLQDAQGHAQRVLDDEIVSMLARQGVQPRLVFLAACQSATRDSADAFLGLGPKLVAVGVPAVVAMQDFVTIETARKFSGAFYARLMEHSLVDQAMNEARSALLTAGRPDAAVPVLFMRLKSGQLWSAESDSTALQSDHSEPPTQSVAYVSGGIAIHADEVRINGDVVGRDKIETAGGDIIHVAAGATLIMGERPAPKAELAPSLVKRQPYEPEMLLVPTGLFLMGSQPGPGIEPSEIPQHEVMLSAYYIGKYPITNREYAEFISREKGKDAPETGWTGRKPLPDKIDYPVVGVTWHDACAYCQWLSQQTGRNYRLPTEAEWEKAARGTDGRTYPWGDRWIDGRCNVGGERGQLMAVSAYPDGASPYGCRDILGNTQEWTSTLWSTGDTEVYRYPYQPQDGREDLDNDHLPRPSRIHRGGSYRDDPGKLRCTARGKASTTGAARWRGFRVAVEP